MEIETVDRSGVTILRLKGRLDVGDGEPVFSQAVTSALGGGTNNLLVEMVGVVKVDSSGAGSLVQARTSCINRGGDLKLLNPSPKVEDVLTITDLIKVFRIFRDENEALASF